MAKQVTNACNDSSFTGKRGLPPWKRALDLSFIVIISPAVLMVGSAVALLIKLGSKGPVFFQQKRVGYKGNEFTCYKFRTMRVNAETESHRMHTAELIKSDRPMIKLDAHCDPRLIPMGALLRAAGLDELPQLWNVVRGEMSLVGPRPCIRYEYEQYEPAHRRRCDAVPGLTGLWQVSGKNRTTFEQMVNFDVEYAQRASLKLDLQILLRTLPALWGQYCDLRLAKSKTGGVSAPTLRKSAEPSRL
jgi:lipopolysaccharide/colanic/teichoic acid biosynthesis glycosyltransferase